MYHLAGEAFLPPDHNISTNLLSTSQATNFDQTSAIIPMLIGDGRRFKQVLMNLVKNALKFTIHGSVMISACFKPDIGMIVVHVEDTGTGIAQEDFPKLFTRFGKLQRTALINSEGIGLGLTLVKQIVQTGGGVVGVESKGVD